MGCQSLGWAFVVVDDEGNLIAAAYGVPPAWVDTIQGAELWAVRVALLCVVYPSKLFTDCSSVRQGVRQPREWAASSKRRLGRIWLVVADQLEGNNDLVQWMPAHTPESAIGSKTCSDGTVVTEVMWLSNQLADLLAKEAAESARISKQDREWLASRDKQLFELCVFVGQLNHAANNYVLPDGTVRRDAEVCKLRRRIRPKSKVVAQCTGSRNEPPRKASRKMSAPEEWVSAWISRSACDQNVQRVPSKALRDKRAQIGITSRQEESFLGWWRESRSQTLAPRDPAAPTAQERLASLRKRVLERTGGSET